MSHSSLRVWKVRLYRLIGVLSILSLLIPPGTVSASSNTRVAPPTVRPAQSRIQTRPDLITTSAASAGTTAPSVLAQTAVPGVAATATPQPATTSAGPGQADT